MTKTGAKVVLKVFGNLTVFIFGLGILDVGGNRVVYRAYRLDPRCDTYCSVNGKLSPIQTKI